MEEAKAGDDKIFVDIRVEQNITKLGSRVSVLWSPSKNAPSLRYTKGFHDFGSFRRLGRQCLSNDDIKYHLPFHVTRYTYLNVHKLNVLHIFMLKCMTIIWC